MSYRRDISTNDRACEPSGASNQGAKPMEFLILLGVLVVWIILQAWLLPRLGVKT
jgi:hypothetical protein